MKDSNIFVSLGPFFHWSSWDASYGSNGCFMIRSNGIEPTVQEKSYFKAKAAYELAYQTHISEKGLRGDMTQSIEAHKRAMDLGYNKARSAFYLACDGAPFDVYWQRSKMARPQ